MPLARVNGVDLYYELAGSQGPALVFVHGSWDDHHSWDLVVPRLSPSFRVLAYDRRGHSQSERPSGHGSWRDDVEDLAALIEHFGLAPAHVVGNSFGACVVLHSALEHPDLFRSMALHEPPFMDLLTQPADRPFAEEVRKATARVVESILAGDPEGGARRFAEEIALAPGAWDRLPRALRETFARNALSFLDEVRDPEAFRIDLAALRSLEVPTLLSRGSRSFQWFPPIVAALADALPKREVHVFEGAGHVPQQTHAARYASIIAGFVRREGTP